jgi:DNA-binding MarR family transcriptional regulator
MRSPVRQHDARRLLISLYHLTQADPDQRASLDHLRSATGLSHTQLYKAVDDLGRRQLVVWAGDPREKYLSLTGPGVEVACALATPAWRRWLASERVLVAVLAFLLTAAGAAVVLAW